MVSLLPSYQQIEKDYHCNNLKENVIVKTTFYTYIYLRKEQVDTLRLAIAVVTDETKYRYTVIYSYL
jgi:hypothetical protein